MVNGIYGAEQVHTLPVWWGTGYFVPLLDGNVSGEKELRASEYGFRAV
ncbi:MAG: hypothetical protein ACLTH3_08640 [Lachnospira sp.]